MSMSSELQDVQVTQTLAIVEQDITPKLKEPIAIIGEAPASSDDMRHFVLLNADPFRSNRDWGHLEVEKTTGTVAHIHHLEAKGMAIERPKLVGRLAQVALEACGVAAGELHPHETELPEDVLRAIGFVGVGSGLRFHVAA